MERRPASPARRRYRDGLVAIRRTRRGNLDSDDEPLALAGNAGAGAAVAVTKDIGYQGPASGQQIAAEDSDGSAMAADPAPAGGPIVRQGTPSPHIHVPPAAWDAMGLDEKISAIDEEIARERSALARLLIMKEGRAVAKTGTM
jgi:hypothetical protein